ncbi:hypothetical protein HaLaN_08872 [Haematococcus lacustris]|uniref:Uncharacterized protein n=1 Tax=Haematococcus lacustris TaxID=44745 RepID=A0A699Z1B7_HAELA|nr:hypothetical protein HaLaN_08872 [Haematococcus lacustris]
MAQCSSGGRAGRVQPQHIPWRGTFLRRGLAVCWLSMAHSQFASEIGSRRAVDQGCRLGNPAFPLGRGANRGSPFQNSHGARPPVAARADFGDYMESSYNPDGVLLWHITVIDLHGGEHGGAAATRLSSALCLNVPFCCCWITVSPKRARAKVKACLTRLSSATLDISSWRS